MARATRGAACVEKHAEPRRQHGIHGKTSHPGDSETKCGPLTCCTKKTRAKGKSHASSDMVPNQCRKSKPSQPDHTKLPMYRALCSALSIDRLHGRCGRAYSFELNNTASGSPRNFQHVNFHQTPSLKSQHYRACNEIGYNAYLCVMEVVDDCPLQSLMPARKLCRSCMSKPAELHAPWTLHSHVLWAGLPAPSIAR